MRPKERTDGAVKTGVYCGYQPDPLTPVTWELSDRQGVR
jgi:hypothetical protein